MKFKHTIILDDENYDASDVFKFRASEIQWVTCPYLFWLDKKMNLRPESDLIFPKIFTKIDSLGKEAFEGKSPKVFSDKLFDGRVHIGRKIVRSKIFRDTLSGLKFYFTGKPDFVLESNCKSKYGIVDDKTSEPNAYFLDYYIFQLLAYRWIYLYPESGRNALPAVDHLGLHVNSPEKLVWPDIKNDENLFWKVHRKYIPFKCDDGILENEMTRLGNIVLSEDPPEKNSSVRQGLWDFIKRESLIRKNSQTLEIPPFLK